MVYVKPDNWQITNSFLMSIILLHRFSVKHLKKTFEIQVACNILSSTFCKWFDISEVRLLLFYIPHIVLSIRNKHKALSISNQRILVNMSVVLRKLNICFQHKLVVNTITEQDFSEYRNKTRIRLNLIVVDDEKSLLFGILVCLICIIHTSNSSSLPLLWPNKCKQHRSSSTISNWRLKSAGGLLLLYKHSLSLRVLQTDS